MSGLILVLRALLATTFIAAVAAKVRPSNFNAFVDSLASASLSPPLLASSLAVLLIGLEAVSATLLVVDSFAVAAFAFSTLTLGILTTGVALILDSHREIECSCFGADGAAITVRHLVRNLLLIGCSTVGLVVAISQPSALQIMWPEGAAYAFAGFVVGVCVVRWDDLAFVAVGAAK